MARTPNGKIARLPHQLREAVNARLLDGQTGPEILAWLNPLPDAAAVFARSFDGQPATLQNLSEWRTGGYAEWLARRERAESLKTLSAFARDLVGSGGNIADGAAAILSGQLLECLEQSANFAVTGGSDDAEADPTAALANMARAVASLQTSGVARQKLELSKRDQKRKEAELALARDRFQRQTVEQFIKWARSPEAAAILESGKPAHVQMSLLRDLMFGPVAGKAKEGSADVP
jgi:hypothetical protein